MDFRMVGFASLVAGFGVGAAFAGDVSYADEHGNLVVESEAGYKRIIVGQARNADRLADYLNVGREDSAYPSGGDRVFADSQGNVTVQSASGYKRILVGRASQVRELRSGAPGGPATELDSGYAGRSNPIVCAPPEGVIKGRGYMYGLGKGATPVILDCP